MAWTSEEVIPTPVANATVVRRLLDGVAKTYRVTPNDGYVLHDTRLDDVEIDPETYEVIQVNSRGYKPSMVSVAASYDFSDIAQETIVGVSGTAYVVDKVGANEFYTLPISEVPTAQIYSGNTDHETA